MMRMNQEYKGKGRKARRTRERGGECNGRSKRKENMKTRIKFRSETRGK